MINVNNYKEEKQCVYKGEHYLARDNGAVLRLPLEGNKARSADNTWTFGKVDKRTGYCIFGGERVHRIVATAFHGEQPSSAHVVDHIDTNRQNNRAENLRWVTRLENILLNPASRKKIEYVTGVDVMTFLADPARFRHLFTSPDLSWMKNVTEEEAQLCKKHFTEWVTKKKSSEKKIHSDYPEHRLGEWIFGKTEKDIQDERIAESWRHYDEDDVKSLTVNAVQRHGWHTPCEFPCCPTELIDMPLQAYLDNLTFGKEFARNNIYVSTVEKAGLSEKGDCLVVLSSVSGVKNFAVAKIVYENGLYIHINNGTYFTPEGAEKYYTLALGKEWTGGDVFDDFC